MYSDRSEDLEQVEVSLDLFELLRKKEILLGSELELSSRQEGLEGEPVLLLRKEYFAFDQFEFHRKEIQVEFQD